MVPWAIIALFNGEYSLTAGLLITWGASQLVRQLIQPKLVGDSIGLNPVPTLILLYLGFRLKGALGLILAVPVGVIVINLYKAGIFSNFMYSIQILFNDVARIRRFSDKELIEEGILKDPDTDGKSSDQDTGK
jgi:predicted PurR-regulated permease PerM